MARTHRYPIFLWSSGPQQWTGRLLDDYLESGTAVASSPVGVMRQLKDYLSTRQDKEGWVPQPDFSDPEVRVLKLQAVPEYETESDDKRRRKRILPCKETVPLKFPYLVGRRESGLHCGMIPSLDIEYEVTRPEEIEDMALHYARRELKGLTPADLLRHLPPVEWHLDSITFSPRREREREYVEELDVLPKIAEHAGSPALRKTARIWERELEALELEKRLRQPKGSVLLIGEAGCGKSSVLIEAARRAEKLTGEGGRRKQRFWVSSGARLIAGMRWLGQWQERLEEVIAELRQIQGVICMESLRELLHYGGNKPESSLAAFLIPYLKSGELRLVVEATAMEVEACERLLPGFLDAFGAMRIEALSPESQERVLHLAAKSISSSQRLDVHTEAALEAGRLIRRFQPYAGFPGAALSLLQDVSSRAKESDQKVVTLAAIRQRFAESTGLPQHLLDETQRLLPADLRQWFTDRLVAQEGAVDVVCRSLLKFKVGLNDPRRPLATLLFVGPTGTGKTQLAKLLGDYLFPHRKESDRLVRLDMSEYAGYDATRRLLGEPFGQPSDLVKRLRQNPFTVLLLDEVEKAAPEVFDTLMNVFDEGRLTDALGRVTWFRSTVIIMTSNLGTKKGGSLGFGNDPSGTNARSDPGAVRAFFRPEFFNRLDQVVTFDPLSADNIRAIARREIAGVQQREGLQLRGLRLEVTPALFDKICAAGFDPVYGARPLQRKIEELVVTPVAKWLVGHPETRDAMLRVDLGGVVDVRNRPPSLH